MIRPFSIPQMQAPLGVLLIFSSRLYKWARGLWIFVAYAIFGKIKEPMTTYLLLGVVVLVFVLIVYSILYYRKFKFHVDYTNSEFILEEGILNTSQTAVPFDRIQQVFFKRSLLQRLVGVYEVVIDTAGSDKQEIKIKALSQADALSLQEVLMQEATMQETLTEDVEFAGEPVKRTSSKVLWSHHLTIGTLFRLGLSTSYLRGVYLILIFFASIFQQFDEKLMGTDLENQIEGYFDSYINMDYLWSVALVLIPITFIIGIIITTIEIFIKYFNLKLTETSTSLDLEMGLRVNTKVSIKSKRVQQFSWHTNSIQRKLNLYEVGLRLASSEGEEKKSVIKIPGLTRDIVGKVSFYLFGESHIDQTLAEFKPHILLFTRTCIVSLIPLLIGLTIWFFTLDYFQWKLILPVIILYLGIMLPWKWFAYKVIHLSFAEEFLIINRGLWKQKTKVVPLFKLQSISVAQPLWYKTRGLYNLTFHTAGGDVSFSAVDKEVLDYMNFTLYKVESSTRAWM